MTFSCVTFKTETEKKNFWFFVKNRPKPNQVWNIMGL